MAGFLSIQSSANQTEVFYIGYFGRAADGPGHSYWINDFATQEAAGMSAVTAAVNIANSFAVQPEARNQYAFLASPPPVLSPTDMVQIAGVDAFISQVYANLFSHAPDSDGLAYWQTQILSGIVSVGSAVYAMANGAIGSDQSVLTVKIVAATELTRRTAEANLVSGPDFLAVARLVRGVVDEDTLRAIISPVIAFATASPLPSPSDGITISTSNGVIDPGRGGHTIQFMGGVTGDTLVLPGGAPDQIVGFDPDSHDVLDLRGLLAEATLNVEDVSPNPEAWFTIADRGADAVLMFDPLGHGGGGTVAVPTGLGSLVTNFSSLLSRNAVQI